MDDFERQMDNVRVQEACMDAALGSAMAPNTPTDQVSALLQQVADEHGLAIAQAMPSAGVEGIAAPAQASLDCDPLSERLARLRG